MPASKNKRRSLTTEKDIENKNKTRKKDFAYLVGLNDSDILLLRHTKKIEKENFFNLFFF